MKDRSPIELRSVLLLQRKFSIFQIEIKLVHALNFKESTWHLNYNVVISFQFSPTFQLHSNFFNKYRGKPLAECLKIKKFRNYWEYKLGLPADNKNVFATSLAKFVCSLLTEVSLVTMVTPFVTMGRGNFVTKVQTYFPFATMSTNFPESVQQLLWRKLGQRL